MIRRPPRSTLFSYTPLSRSQHDTDLRHLVRLAERHGYVAYVVPGPAPATSRFYWGPPVRAGLPQRAISVDLGPETNVTRSEEHTSELQSRQYIVCRFLLEKK